MYSWKIKVSYNMDLELKTHFGLHEISSKTKDKKIGNFLFNNNPHVYVSN